MNVFLAHVGAPGNIDIDYTVLRRRSFVEFLSIPADAPERLFLRSSELRRSFPIDSFNCWGVPNGAVATFERMREGDLVLIAPTIGGDKGGIHQLGVVRALCPVSAYAASRILWPRTPNEKLFPLLFFFDTEVGYRPWRDYLKDIGYQSNFDPRGKFLSVRAERFSQWGGAEGYLEFLRREADFRGLA